MTAIENARRHAAAEIETVAMDEGLDPDTVKSLVAAGHVAILRSARSRAHPLGVGRFTRTKINANVGTSMDIVDIGAEMEKVRTAVRYGADTVMDLSTGGNLDRTRKMIIQAAEGVPVGSVPVYQAASRYSDPSDMSSDDMFNCVRKHARDGIDFVTIHAGVNRNAVERLRQSDRILGVVSRGGAFLVSWMQRNGENPFYAEYDYLLELAHEYDLTLSLGDGMRPGCIQDASDRAKFMEFITLGELVRRARAAGVQSMVEGPGHVPLDEIALSVSAMKHICNDAPLYLLGPLVTDIAPGYDHITAAIGGAVAGMHGADFLCMTTPAEHLALPTIDDIREGAAVTKIAAHAADLTRPGQRERARALDREMAIARSALDWHRQFQLCLDGERARAIHRESGEACTMCGELCSIKIMREAMGKK